MRNFDIKPTTLKTQKTLIFLIGFTFWELSFLLKRLTISTSFNSSIYFYLRVIGLVVILSSEFFSFSPSLSGHDFSIKKTSTYFIVTLFIIYNNFYLAGTTWYIDIILIIFCGRDIDFRQFLKFMLIVFVIYYVAVIFFSFIGIIPSLITYRELGMRNSMGFKWSTWPAFGFLYISLIYMVLRAKNVTYFELLIISVIAYFFYHFTNTRFAFILTVLLVLVWLFKKISSFNFYDNIITRNIIFLLYPILIFIIYFFSKHSYNFVEIDKLISGRLTLGHSALLKYGIKLFGQHTNFSASRDTIGIEYSYVDSSMLQLLIIYGLVATVIVVVTFYLLEKKIVDSKNDYLLIAITFIIINGFTDPQLLEPFYNIFFVLIGCLLINDKDAINSLKLER